MTTTIAVAVGSLRKDSINRKLAQAVEKLLPADVKFSYLSIGDLPLYNQDDDANPHANVVKLKEAISAAQGVLFFTPEYNRSVPGVLKNAIDHASRPYGKSAWNNKPAAVLGLAGGPIGTALAQQHLRNVLAYLNMPTLGQPEMFLQAKEGFFGDDGGFGNEETKKFVQVFLDKYLAWVAKHA
ncbi:MAG: NAD(P)H-dependent oxidoreductase [Burkholderiales bacterium]|nr:MAG: NAD(P)H-dependent oxidoreductase [Burkholderiales bacterium]